MPKKKQEDILVEDAYLRKIEIEIEKTFSRVIQKTSQELAESYIRQAYKLGIQILNKYNKIAQSYGYNDIVEFLEETIKFYENKPIVDYLNDRLQKLEIIYTAILYTVYKIYLILSDVIVFSINILLQSLSEGKITSKELFEILKELLNFYHDAFNRIIGQNISEIIRNSEETGISDSGYFREKTGRHRKNASKGHTLQAHDDATKSAESNNE